MIKPGIGREYEEEEIMKKSMTVFIALAVLAAGGAAWALDTNTLTVSGQRDGNLQVPGSQDSTLNFGRPGSRRRGTCHRVIRQHAVLVHEGRDHGHHLTGGTGSNCRGSARRRWRIRAATSSRTRWFSHPAAGTNAGPDSPRTLNIAGTVLATDYTGWRR